MSKSNISYMMTDNAITVFYNCHGYVVDKGDSRFEAVDKAIQTENYDAIPTLLDIKGALISETNGELRLLNGVLKYKGDIVEPILAGRIIKMKAKGYNFSRFVLFLENLYDNPTPTAKAELFGFLEACNLPITPDGCFLAYKMVRTDFMDIHSNSMDNSIGMIVKMDRADVDDDRNRTCSSGLHFCSEEYLGSYGREGSSQIVVLKINPRNVVSIPTDYHNSKGRADEYEVVDAIKWDDRITPDFSDEYTDSAPDSELDSGNTDEIVDMEFRWEIRDSDTAEYVEAFETRSEAREYRNGEEEDVFIFDNLQFVVVAGRTDPEFDLNDLDSFLDSMGAEEDVIEDTGRDRWEVRDSRTGAYKHSVSSRLVAREHLNVDEFIWDSENGVKVNGKVDPSVDFNYLD